MSFDEQLIALTADIVSSHLANNTVSVGDVSHLINQVHTALAGLDAKSREAPPGEIPVVSAAESVQPNYVACMKCGKKRRSLKRHLEIAHDMTPEEYRKVYQLPHDHLLVAPEYSARRSSLAKVSGLGRKRQIGPLQQTDAPAAPAASVGKVPRKAAGR